MYTYVPDFLQTYKFAAKIMAGAAISVTRRKEVLPAPVGRGINWLATERLATVRAIHVSLYKTYLHNIHELVVFK